MKLSTQELNFLVGFFSHWADPFRAFDKYNVFRRGFPFGGPYEIDLGELIKKKVIVESPDGYQIKLTDLGYELMVDHVKNKQEWSNQRVVRVGLQNKDETLIPKGSFYKGYRVIRDIFISAKSSLWVQDPYIGPDIFSIIDELDDLDIKIIIGTKTYKERESAILAYKKIEKERKNIEMKTSSEIHNRYIFIDQDKIYQVGGSIKDLGGKEDIIITVKNYNKLLDVFNTTWLHAKKL